MSGFLAHSRNTAGRVDFLADHLLLVADRAAEYAAAFGEADEARLAGLLHDLGKYGPRFQRRLAGQEAGIDHWSAGAWVAIKQFKSVAAALAIQGHHLGLHRASKDSLSGLNPAKLLKQHPQGMRLSSDDDVELLVDHLKEEVGPPAAPAAPLYSLTLMKSAAAMCDVRMLFSALVDADYLETEAHFNPGPDGERSYRVSGPELDAVLALRVLDEHLDRLARRPDASEGVARLRGDLLAACRAAAQESKGVFNLSAPTGSGKTLAMLAFALQHAATHDLRRIVVVIPYLSIIEQTARVYREVFASRLGEQYILEHHSLAGTRPEGDGNESGVDNEEEALRVARLLSENWDAPIILTTSVQLLESLFANRPAACRKLHRLARSVILFDEVQTLPPQLAPATLATLSHLVERYKSTVVFATATQPAFRCLEKEVQRLGGRGWKPEEIARPELALFGRAKRTHVNWPDLARPTSWDEVAGRLAELPSVLCIVNLKRHAVALLNRLKGLVGVDHLHHLSTHMCPAHRMAVLEVIRRRLDEGEPCRVVATQCIEAGVDVDFPVLYRAFGPLEAIAQAAGRCNRRGKLSMGEVHVFLPYETDGRWLYPPGVYSQAADTTRIVLQNRGSERMNLDDPGLFEEYYRTFYDLTKIASADQGRAGALAKAIHDQDFAKVAELYRLIPNTDSINVLVPYDLAAYNRLADEVRQRGLNAEWMRRAQPHVVSLFRPGSASEFSRQGRASPLLPLEAVPIARRGASDDWFIYCMPDHYDPVLGLNPLDTMGFLNA
jgi:CRISPR-associated helicase Cas3/CRISPR-associated endonuclease Cas3-HD